MPRYSIDALNPSGSRAWRLQDDHTWRKAQFAEPLSAGDLTTTDPAEARRWLAGRLQKDWRGRLSWEAAPDRGPFAPGEIGIHPIAHREGTARVPDREALQRVLAQAPADERRVLCLDTDGNFRLRDPEAEPLAGDPDLAAHGDSLSGAAYLGPEAAADSRYVDETYRKFLGAWYQHLRSGRVSLYAGEAPWDLDTDTLIARIQEWRGGGQES
ncbi:hypothetical protein [Thiohalorhabdus denitrificans]|uniref:Uncharacterized protein n=1 Tax=Thiohalorhabdus denitrificans TaxID=381306 RepID=A0A1G5FQD5_9GAMM|nr:hypothetical protein [Thiohalorhabdus denitrificans]SCY41354.1 hypothetical protein SAMN05661077_2063 [Thiohalorhabdus denitrificans]